MQPLVSVIIPAFNHGKYLKDAIESVIDQDNDKKEIIVVDDGSTDDTGRIANIFSGQIMYLFQENNGVSAARNKGIAHAKGEYLAFLDADDIWLPKKLTKQLEVVSKNKEIGLVGCGYYNIDENRKIIGDPWVRFNYPDKKALLDALSIMQIVPGGTSGVLIRRECFEKLKGFDEEIQIGEDWDMWLKIARNYDVEFITEPLILRRKGSSAACKVKKRVGDKLLSNEEKEEYYVKQVIEKNLEGKIKRRAYACLYHRLGSQCLANADTKEAFRYLVRSLYLRPFGLYPKDPERRFAYPKDSRYYLLAKIIMPNNLFAFCKKIIKSILIMQRISVA